VSRGTSKRLSAMASLIPQTSSSLDHSLVHDCVDELKNPRRRPFPWQMITTPTASCPCSFGRRHASPLTQTPRSEDNDTPSSWPWAGELADFDLHQLLPQGGVETYSVTPCDLYPLIIAPRAGKEATSFQCRSLPR